MGKILVCQHVPYELLGTLNPLCKEFGFRIRYINFGRHPHATPSLEGYDGLIILGGPMNVDETKQHPFLHHELKMIEEGLKNEIPILGICLGAQLIAKALGAKVAKNPTKEIGWYDVSLTEEGKKDSLFTSYQTTEKMFQWHGDTFDIPKGAIHLAASKTCASQAFRYGTNVYGFQFHLEVDEKMIHRWFQIPHNKKEIEELKAFDSHQILKETQTYIDRLKSLSQETFTKYIQLHNFTKPFRRLTSR